MQVINTHYILKISCIKFKTEYCNFITKKTVVSQATFSKNVVNHMC